MYTSPIRSNILLFVFLVLFTFLAACGESKVDSPPNKAPTIVLNSESVFNEQTHAEMNVSASYDNDGEIVAYLWEQTAGP